MVSKLGRRYEVEHRFDYAAADEFERGLRDAELDARVPPDADASVGSHDDGVAVAEVPPDAVRKGVEAKVRELVEGAKAEIDQTGQWLVSVCRGSKSRTNSPVMLLAVKLIKSVIGDMATTACTRPRAAAADARNPP